MKEVLISNAVQIIITSLVAIISVAAVWIIVKIGKYKELDSIAAALAELTDCTVTTVGELQQTFVDGWKEASSDGKLTKEEIKRLGSILVNRVTANLSVPAKNLINAAGIDIIMYIHSVAEDTIHRINENKE